MSEIYAVVSPCMVRQTSGRILWVVGGGGVFVLTVEYDNDNNKSFIWPSKYVQNTLCF